MWRPPYVPPHPDRFPWSHVLSGTSARRLGGLLVLLASFCFAASALQPTEQAPERHCSSRQPAAPDDRAVTGSAPRTARGTARPDGRGVRIDTSRSGPVDAVGVPRDSRPTT